MSLYIFFIYFCTTYCFVSTFAHLVPFETQQLYKLRNRVDLSDIRRIPYTTGYEITTQLKVSSIWNKNERESQLLHFKLEPVEQILTKISKNKNDIPNYNTQNSPESQRLKYLDFYLYLEDGQIKKFLAHKEDRDAFSLNFKKGLGSLFQYQSEKHEQILQETDLLGSCSVSYHFKSTTQFSKTKLFCRDWDLKVGQRHEKPLGIERESNQKINYKLTQDLMLYEVEAIEIHKANLAIKTDSGIKIESHINLSHISSDTVAQKIFTSIENIAEELKDYKMHNIEADIDGRISHINLNLKQLLKTYKNDMNNLKIGKLSTAYIFCKLLPVARITKSEEFTQILKSRTMEENLNQIIDLLGATQTIEAHTAFMNVYHFENEDDFEAIERYLQALSIATHPKKDIFLNLYEKLITIELFNENPKLYDSLIQTLSSIANKYSIISPDVFEDKIILKIKDYLIHKLNECKESNCKVIYIRGLQNLKDPSTIINLIELALEKDMITSIQAMKALKTFDYKLFSKKEHKLIENIFYQFLQKYDSSARTMALDILLQMKPSKVELINLLEYLRSNDEAYEVKRYLIEKINLLMSKCSRFKALLKDILKDKPEINNYHIIGQKGMTSVLERVLSETPAFNESLFSTQEIFNGVLKQGNVDCVLKSNDDELSSFKLGLFTSGLSSFISSSSSDYEQPTEPEEVKAGMEITIQNVHFRPLIFFNGQSELMGHVWSGTASEPTTAYQGTVIQQDHEEYILLQNGATIFLQIVGSKSIDLNGKIEFSLWNRNAQTEIKKSSGETIFGTIIYGTSFIKMKNEFSIESNPKISVNANVDFYDNIKLCIQLEKPKSSLRHRIENTLEIIGDSKVKSNSVMITNKLPGKTLALNQKNNEMCNMIG